MKTKYQNYSLIKKLFLEGIKAVSPSQLIGNSLRLEKETLIISDFTGHSETIKLNQFENIFIIGAGKASAAMALKTESILGELITGGVIVTKYGFGKVLERVILIEAGHPVPDVNGIIGAEKIIEVCKNAGEHDLIINLLSGGASALLPMPADGISLDEKAKTTNLLLKSGATINELNTIRKHLSKIKGGKLLEYSYPAKIISLILSDVVGDKLDIIGSGIMVKDTSTHKDCNTIIQKYNFQNTFPKSVISLLQKGYYSEIETENLKENSIFNVSNFIVGNNSIALTKIKNEATREGYKTEIVSWQLEGEAKIVAKDIVEHVLNFIKHKSEPNKKYCFIYGGETSVTIYGNGKGGRNQELVLAAAMELNNKKGITLLSGGTDGNDGPTDVAGAICNGNTVNDGLKLGASASEYLIRNDSYNYFKAIDSLVITGPTGTNVMDVQIILVET